MVDIIPQHEIRADGLNLNLLSANLIESDLLHDRLWAGGLSIGTYWNKLVCLSKMASKIDPIVLNGSNYAIWAP